MYTPAANELYQQKMYPTFYAGSTSRTSKNWRGSGNSARTSSPMTRTGCNATNRSVLLRVVPSRTGITNSTVKSHSKTSNCSTSWNTPGPSRGIPPSPPTNKNSKGPVSPPSGSADRQKRKRRILEFSWRCVRFLPISARTSCSKITRNHSRSEPASAVTPPATIRYSWSKQISIQIFAIRGSDCKLREARHCHPLPACWNPQE